MNLEQEKRLIKQARNDPDAFGQIFDMYYQKIFNYVLKRVSNVELARDITSETFYKAYKNLWQFKWKNLSISSWFYRIATNESNYYLRKNR